MRGGPSQSSFRRRLSHARYQSRKEQKRLGTEVALRRAKLSDEDWAIAAAIQLGGCSHVLTHSARGVMIEKFLLGDDDITQAFMRLERAALVGVEAQVLDVTPVMGNLIEAKLKRALVRKKRQKP